MKLFQDFFGDIGCVPFADLRLRNLAEKQNAQFTAVGKNPGQISSHLWTKVHDILRQRRRPLVIPNAHTRLFISRLIPKT